MNLHSPKQPVTYPAEQVWGLAVRADQMNNGYVKEPQYATRDGILDYNTILVQPNKILVKQWLRDQIQPTAAEIEQGLKYRDHFKGYTLKALAGGLNDFQHQALKIAAKDEFTGRDMLEFSIVSCLPDVARRDQQRTDFKRELYSSQALQVNEGDTVSGHITVTQSRFNTNYNKYRIVARMGESFIDFWFTRNLNPGFDYAIKGKVKQLRADKTTQLNYVKITG